MEQDLVGEAVFLELSVPDPTRDLKTFSLPLEKVPAVIASKHDGPYGRRCYYVTADDPFSVGIGGHTVRGRLLSITGEGSEVPPQLDYLALDLRAKGEAYGRAELVLTLNPPKKLTLELLHESDGLPLHLRDFIALGAVRVTLRRSV
jgi:hypothetical protein